MSNNDNSAFSYTYSAREQEEIKKIRDKYAPRGEDKMEKLRRLDAGVGGVAQAVSLVFGVIGTLILGFGMSLIMSELSNLLGMQPELSLILGLAVGIFGAALVGLAYPVYRLVLRREKERVAPEIMRLTDELMK